MGSKLKLEKRLRNAEYAKKFKKKKKRTPRPVSSSSMPVGGAEVICAACGIQTHVPFQPTNGKPVYCRSCFTKPQPTVTSVTMSPPMGGHAPQQRLSGAEGAMAPPEPLRKPAERAVI